MPDLLRVAISVGGLVASLLIIVNSQVLNLPHPRRWLLAGLVLLAINASTLMLNLSDLARGTSS